MDCLPYKNNLRMDCFLSSKTNLVVNADEGASSISKDGAATVGHGRLGVSSTSKISASNRRNKLVGEDALPG